MIHVSARGKKRGKVVHVLALLLVSLLLSSVSVIAFKSGGGNNPPPPKCSFMQQGCYNDKGGLASGPLSRDAFGFFLSDNSCTPGNPGNCQGCPSVAPQSIPKVENPNLDFGACSCIQGAVFDANVGCCGDADADCGIVSNGVLCSMNQNLNTEGWLESAVFEGRVNYVGCPAVDREFLSTGADWIACDSVKIETVLDHQYLCSNKNGKESWVECCGDDACNSGNGGLKLVTGDNVIVGNTTHFCTSESTFVDDLDQDESACLGASHTWTGNACCGDESDESYIDEDLSCFFGNVVGQGIVTGSDAALIGVEQDQMDIFGCRLQDLSPDLLTVQNARSSGALVDASQDIGSCALDVSEQFFCSHQGEWIPTNGVTDVVLAEVPDTETVDEPSGCCLASACWNGSACIVDQLPQAGDQQLHFDQYRCHGGEWIQPLIKVSKDGTQRGFCPDEEQCLVTTAGQFSNNNNPDGDPQCIDDLQYQADDLCTQGNWSSRTRAIAIELLDFAQGQDFTLFCDEKENTLNDVTAVLGGEGNAFFVEQSNNICILQIGDQIIFGTSFNVEPTNAQFDAIFNIDSCSGSDDGQYVECTSQLRYNKKLKSVLYSEDPLTIVGDPSTLKGRFITFIWDVFSPIIDVVRLQPHQSLNRLESIFHFNRIFISKQGTEQITAVLDVGTEQNIIVRYEGFSENICEKTEPFLPQDNSGVSCIQTGDAQVLHLQGNSVRNFDPIEFWADVGAKVR